MSFIRNFVNEEEGQSMIEYALLAGIIAVAAISVRTLIRGNMVDVFGTVDGALAGATVGDAG